MAQQHSCSRGSAGSVSPLVRSCGCTPFSLHGLKLLLSSSAQQHAALSGMQQATFGMANACGCETLDPASSTPMCGAQICYDTGPAVAEVVSDRALEVAGSSSDSLWDRGDLWERFGVMWREGSPKVGCAWLADGIIAPA